MKKHHHPSFIEDIRSTFTLETTLYAAFWVIDKVARIAIVGVAIYVLVQAFSAITRQPR
mgnify:CR=1 FL=1